MEDSWGLKWDERYSKKEYAYGELPNEFLKEQLKKLPVGTILFPAEGEGRNAVYAAQMGWTVSAFDISRHGQKKAALLAERKGVTIDYQVGDLEMLHYAVDHFDAIALIYAHFPAPIKSEMHQTLSKYLRPGGTLIFEAFSKSHLAYQEKNEKVGGPKDLPSLFSIEEIKSDFSHFEVELLEETEIILNEGTYHKGQGSVIRFVGKKRHKSI